MVATDVLCSLALYGPIGNEPIRCLERLSVDNVFGSVVSKAIYLCVACIRKQLARRRLLGNDGLLLQEAFARRLTARVDSAAIARSSVDPALRQDRQLRRYANLAESLAAVKTRLLSLYEKLIQNGIPWQRSEAELGIHWRSDLASTDVNPAGGWLAKWGLGGHEPLTRTRSREELEAEASRIALAYDYMDVIYVRDKELHDRTGRFDEYLAVVGSIALRALKDHGWRLKRDDWRESLLHSASLFILQLPHSHPYRNDSLTGAGILLTEPSLARLASALGSLICW